jgi:hypothetical protein
MTPQEARSEIERTTNALAEAGLAVDFNLPILRRDGPEVIVTWPAAPPQGRVFSEGFLASIQEYRQLVVQRQYTCALVDGALVQISFTFRNAEMIRNRLCYYPCPLTFQAGDWDPTEIPLLDVFDTVLVDEFDGVLDGMGDALPNPSPPRLRMRGPIRFDYAPEQQAETHPASHAHIGGDDAR